MNSRSLLFLALVAAILVGGCGPQSSDTPHLSGDLQTIAADRGLTPDDLVAAAKTYMPTGKHDEYYMFASGGHSGQVLVLGIPSMRLLKVIAAYTPEPWQGWGYSNETRAVLSAANPKGAKLDWGDTHHPALSETGGNYDGQFLFINDKANARVAVIDLRDFETKQIVKNPLLLSDHGGTFVTPNTDYVIEGSQYGMPWMGTYAPLSEYKEKYRGAITFWKFDREKGRIDKNKSFALELPPYWQDLADAGKKVSDGWVFLNTFNTEMATGGVEDGNPPFEAGASQRDMDYLNVINLRKAEALYKEGKTEKINGFDVIPLATLVEEGVLFFVPEPKSPHGIDHLRLREDHRRNQQQAVRRNRLLRGPDFGVRRRPRGTGRSRPGAAAHAVRSGRLCVYEPVSGIDRCPLDAGWRVDRKAPQRTMDADRQGLDPL